MKRRAFIGMTVVGLAGAATCSWWEHEAQPRPDLVRLESQQTRRFVPADVGTEMWAVLRVTVDEGPTDQRPPVHVGLVIDTSASMDGAAIEAARAAAAELVGSLHEGDRLTVVTFDSRAELVVPNLEIDDDTREACLEAIAAIEARGTTDLAAGLHTALGDLLPHTAEGRVTRIVVLSDGVPNEADSIPSAVAQASSAGITVTALGFGLDYDETLLASIAQQTGGTFHFLEAPEQLVPLFREENLRLQGIEAREMVLTLTTGPKVELREVVGQSIGLGQPRVFLGLGDLSRGEERVVVVRLSVGPHHDGATVELLDASLTYRDPRTGESFDRDTVFLSAKAQSDQAVLAESIDPQVEREIESAKAAALTLHAVALSREGKLVDAKNLLEQARPVAAEAAARLSDEELAEQAEEMDELVEVFRQETEEDSEDAPIGPGVADGAAGAVMMAKPKPRLEATRGPVTRKVVRKAHGNAMSKVQARRNRL